MFNFIVWFQKDYPKNTYFYIYHIYKYYGDTQFCDHYWYYETYWDAIINNKIVKYGY